MQNKVVIVTGGGRGIGAATARLFALKGYSVCINFKSDHDAANRFVEEIKCSGVDSIAVQADVSQENQVIELFQTVDTHLGTQSKTCQQSLYRSEGFRSVESFFVEPSLELTTFHTG